MVGAEEAGLSLVTRIHASRRCPVAHRRYPSPGRPPAAQSMHRAPPGLAQSTCPGFRRPPPSSSCLPSVLHPLLVQKFAMHLHRHMFLLILFLEFPPTLCLPGDLQGHVSTSILFASPLDVAAPIAMAASTSCSLVGRGSQAVFNIYHAQQSLGFLYPSDVRVWSLALLRNEVCASEASG